MDKSNYILKDNKFGYKYNGVTSFNGSDSQKYIGVPVASYGGGKYRLYKFKINNVGVNMISENGDLTWNISANGIVIYKDITDLSSSSMTRVWKRVSK